MAVENLDAIIGNPLDALIIGRCLGVISAVNGLCLNPVLELGRSGKENLGPNRMEFHLLLAGNGAQGRKSKREIKYLFHSVVPFNNQKSK